MYAIYANILGYMDGKCYHTYSIHGSYGEGHGSKIVYQPAHFLHVLLKQWQLHSSKLIV